MDGFRHQGRPVYYKQTPDTYAYQNLYGTVRGNPNGKVRPALDFESAPVSGRTKKFNFLPWKKNKNKADDSFTVSNGTLSRHNKFKFGSVSALTSSSLYRDWNDSLSTTPSYSSSDLKHATVRSINGRPRGPVTYPWETYNNKINNNNETINYKNNQLNRLENKKLHSTGDDHPKPISINNSSPLNSTLCKCQKKNSGAFGTLNLGSLKSSKCNCGFASVRSSRGFAPPPPPRRRSILPEKVDLYAVHEDQVHTDSQYSCGRRNQENLYDTLKRSNKYKAPNPPAVQSVNYNPNASSNHSKLMKSLEKCNKDPFSSVASRKSILECDVTAYDLVKTYLKKDSSNGSDSDLDDDLSDNVIEEKNSNKELSESLKKDDKNYKMAYNKSPSPVSSESESGIYSQNSSLRIGGHGMKVLPQLDGNSSPQTSLYSEGSKTNSVDSRTSSWSNSSLSDDGIYSLPEPDYDDDKDADSTLRFEDRIYSTPTPGGVNLRKYSSGNCLANNEPASHYSDIKNGHYESPRFPTIRKATSMMSLASAYGDTGTLRGRGKVPRAPEVPTISSSSVTPSPAPSAAPPPPPPPPPPPDFAQWKSPTQMNAIKDKEGESLPKKDKKIPINNMSSSIASELAEKLKSNKPILKKNEIKPKQPMKVNSHNPYAEVKSILKKTGEKLTASAVNGSSDEASSRDASDLQDAQDTRKKKRVQFKSLSNESLAVERIQNEALSSSDEEWEEARDSFTSDSSSATTHTLRKKNDEDFQTVEQYLRARKDEENQSAKPRSSGDKSEAKQNSRISTIPRPSQPPPPPPNIRKGNVKGPPPPSRPLSSTPKSYSHSDLRVATSNKTQKDLNKPGLSKTVESLRPGQRTTPLAQQSRGKSRVPIGGNATIADSISLSSTSTHAHPKNGVSSPAASPEATTSPRGKSFHDNGDHSIPSEQPHIPNELDIEPTADDSSSDSSYMSVPSTNSHDYADCSSQPSTELKKSTEKCRSDTAFESSVPNFQEKATPVTCTIVNIGSEENSNYSILKIQNGVNNSVNALQDYEEKNSEELSSGKSTPLTSDIEGPVYSKLLYVSRRSPSPPPLPRSLPPLPPKRNACLSRNQGIASYPPPPEEGLYDTLPMQKSRKMSDQSIYESRKYKDTGATVVTISSGASDSVSEHIYFSVGSDSIYEELPGDKESTTIYVSTNPFGQHRRSFFNGASKAEILKFLERAKDRVVDELDDDTIDEDDDELHRTKNVRNNPIRISNISSSSDTSTASSSSSTSQEDDVSTNRKTRHFGSVEIERADSGVGSETSKPAVTRRKKPSVDRRNDEVCADCDQQLEAEQSDSLNCCPLVCEKCDKKRSERKEIVTEIVETEFKYGKDLLIIKEEFKSPMEVAGLLTKEQLNGIFLNLDELILVNAYFSEKLKDATDIAMEQGDEDYTTVNIGKIFLETTTMLRAFEVYCIRQGSASVLLTNLEKEKELLRIFLKVSQMENTLLRRMNLSAFLMVPVQRVTKYPLLLSRLYKVTPYHHKDREALREAQLKIELHLEQINQQTKGITGTKIWRRISNISAAHRRSVNISDIGSIQLRKMAMEVLEWSKEDIRFVMAGKLAFSGTIDFTKSRRGRAIKFSPSHALLATKGKPNSNYRPDQIQETGILFPRNTGIEDATLLLMKEKNGKYSLARDPLHLGVCVISAELEDEDIIEIQEYTTKESIFLKAECKTDTIEWLKQLRYHAKDLGAWKRRRNALANIMINGMIRQQ